MNDTTLTPQEHSGVVGGSSAARRLGCPASYRLEKIAPPDTGSEYARAGTAMHELVALILKGDKDPEEMVPFQYQHPKPDGSFDWGYTIDEDEWSTLGQPALDAFDEFVDQMEAETKAEFSFIVETRCEFPGIPNAFGTSDVIWRCGGKAGVWDWKFGRTPVKAEGNEQLAFYARAAINTRPDFFTALTEGDSIALSICQPQAAGVIDTWWTSREWLALYADDLRDAVVEAQTAETPHMEKGKWCQFANCRPICPLHTGAVAELGRKLLEVEQVKAASEPGIAPTPELAQRLSEAMTLAATVEAWLSSVSKAVQSMLEGGTPVPGWKLVDKRSSGKEWIIPDAKVASRLRSRGLKTAEFMIKRLVSPTQAEKLLKKIDKELPADAFQQKPSSGHTLAPDSDERPDAAMPHEKVAALAERLADMATKQVTKGTNE